MAIALVTILVLGLDLDVPRVGDLASLAGGFPLLFPHGTFNA